MVQRGLMCLLIGHFLVDKASGENKMSEYWARDINNAKLKLKEGDIKGSIDLLKSLLNSKFPECVRESKKLLAKILIEFENNKDEAKIYLEDLYREKKDLQSAIELMLLSSEVGNLSDVNKFYDELIHLMPGHQESKSILIKYYYLSSLVNVRASFIEALNVVDRLLEDYKKLSSLDHQFLSSRKIPGFFDFIKCVETLFLQNNKQSEFINFIRSQLSWVDDSGKMIVNEFIEKFQ